MSQWAVVVCLGWLYHLNLSVGSCFPVELKLGICFQYYTAVHYVCKVEIFRDNSVNTMTVVALIACLGHRLNIATTSLFSTRNDLTTIPVLLSYRNCKYMFKSYQLRKHIQDLYISRRKQIPWRNCSDFLQHFGNVSPRFRVLSELSRKCFHCIYINPDWVVKGTLECTSRKLYMK